MSSLESVTEFSTDLYRFLAENQPLENAFISPSSIVLVMNMVFLGSSGNTAEQMKKSMRLEKVSRQDLLQSMKNLMTSFKSETNDYNLSVANKIFPHKDKTILEEYINEISSNFQTEVKGMDFTNKAEACRQEINAWVEKETRDKIKNLIQEGVINSLTAMVLVNAIYFKGDWEDKFDQADTRKAEFTMSDGTRVLVDMMFKRFKKGWYGENQDLSCKVLSLPYKGGDISMLVILPDKHDGLPKLEKKLNGKVIKDLLSEVRQVQVHVNLPKFKLESSYQLADVLSKLGMPDLFDMNKADLTKMNKEDQLYVSHVLHKAFIEVNEEGSEAAAATAAVIMRRSMPIIMKFNADHPFMYMIWDNRANIPLFMGRIVSPPNGIPVQKEEL